MITRSLIILLFVNTVFYSQFCSEPQYSSEQVPLSSLLKKDGLLSFNKSIELLKSPLTFDDNDMIMTGVVLAITGASFSMDNRIRTDVINQRNDNLDNITYYGEKFGRPVYASILSGLLYTSGLIFDDSELRETGQILAEAMICTGIYTQFLKISLARARPFKGDGNLEIEPLEFEFDSSENSLPSGHTSIAFTVATVLSNKIDNIFATVALYSMASLTAYQRIYSDVHWFSDTILGAALGTFIGLKLLKLHENSTSEEDDDDYKINVFPQIDSHKYGVGVAMQF